MSKLIMALSLVVEILISGVVHGGYLIFIHYPNIIFKKLRGRCEPYCKDWTPIGPQRYKCRRCGQECDL
jgi:hypothetical protein